MQSFDDNNKYSINAISFSWLHIYDACLLSLRDVIVALHDLNELQIFTNYNEKI